MCFSHIDADGNAVMVDVTEKAATHRRAVAAGSIRMNEEAFAAVRLQAACNFSSTRKAARSRRSVPYSATEKREWRWRR